MTIRIANWLGLPWGVFIDHPDCAPEPVPYIDQIERVRTGTTLEVLDPFRQSRPEGRPS